MLKTQQREFAYSEIYPPIMEKQKVIDACERSVFQLLFNYFSNNLFKVKKDQRLIEQLLKHMLISLKRILNQ